MKFIFWNCRGIENLATQCTLFNFCNSHKPDFLCLAEPKVYFSSIPSSFYRSLYLSFVMDNALRLPSIWVLVSDDIGASNVSVLSSSDQHC